MRKIKFIYWLLGVGCGIAFTAIIGTFLSLKVSENITTTSYSEQKESIGTIMDREVPVVNANKDKEEIVSQDDKIATSRTIYIPKGMGAGDVCSLLKQMTIVEDDEAFLAYIKENKKEKKIKDGRFNLQTKMSYKQLLEALTL